MIKTVIKRDGREVEFNTDRIVNAIELAMKDTEQGIDKELSVHIANDISKIDKDKMTVEEIQDLVEDKLMDSRKDIAKEYIKYRNERTKARDKKSNLMKVIDSIGVETDRDNANVGNNFSSKLLRIASESNKWHNLRMMPKHLAKLHENGDLYYHDLDSYNLTINCLNIDTGDVLNRGFNTGYGTILPARRIESASELSCILLQSTQNDMFGGQAHVNFDNDLAPFVKMTREEIKKEYKNDFKNIENLDEMVEKKLEKVVHQSMQGIVYNLNTMHSRAGSQVPFSSLNLGLPTNKEAEMICRIFLEEYEKGLGKGEQPIFPNIIFRVKEGVNREPQDPYYNLYELACRVASKRMNPMFMNLDADFNKEYYEQGHIPATMGCVDGKELVTYKVDDNLYVESFERMWDRLSNIFTIKEQQTKDNYYMDLKNIKIYDTQKGFVGTHKIIKNKDKGDWMRIKFSNGRTLLATSDHPLPVINKGRTYVKDLKIEDKIIINQKQYVEDNKECDIDKSWLLGMILCDGCYDGNITTSINAKGEDDIELNYKKVFKRVFGLNVDTKLHQRGKKGNYKDLICHGEQVHIKNELKQMFGGVKKIDRHIPNEVFTWNKGARMSFLAGMIDADGYINSKNHSGSIVQIGSTNKELSLQTMALAQSLGFPTKVYLNHCTSKDKNKIRYRIEFCASLELLKYLSCHKKINNFIKQPNIVFCSIASVTEVESLGHLNKHSYDVTTESDYFEISGLYSHNCRTAIMSNVNGEAGAESRGNIAPTTINLPRLGILAKGDINKFFELLDNRLQLARESLIHRYGILKRLKVKDLPFVIGQHLMKGSENLTSEDSIEPVLQQGTWGIGFIGLAETLIALTGKHHGEDKNVYELGIKIISYIREFCDKYKEIDKMNWSCYASPAEGLSGKFIKQDKAKFGIVNGVTDKDYYTNSYHIPVHYKISIKDKIDLEAPFHKLCNGGHITYIEIDDYPTPQLIKTIIDYAYRNTNISYMGINFHMRYCRECGTKIEQQQVKCSKCGSRNIQGVSRVTGYLSLDERFGEGKVAERKDRLSHNDSEHINTYGTEVK